jgi:hypothetical protein
LSLRQLIKKTCINIETLDLLILTEHYNYTLGEWAVATDALKILDTHFKSITSLKEIIANFKEYPDCDLNNYLTKKLHNIG